MAVRIRKDRKTIVCAAESKPEMGDCYLDDNIQHTLVSEMKILKTNDEGETWYFETDRDGLVCPRCGVVFHDEDMNKRPEDFWTCPTCSVIQHQKCRGF